MAVIFHDLPVGDRPLVRMPLQKVLVRFHHGSSDTLRDCFLLMPFCIAFVAACFCLPGVLIFIANLDCWDFVIGSFWTCDV